MRPVAYVNWDKKMKTPIVFIPASILTFTVAMLYVSDTVIVAYSSLMLPENLIEISILQRLLKLDKL